MTKQQKIKAFKEAIKQAQEMLDFYKGYIKTAEDLETKDTSELTCIGSFFNCFPNSGYEPSKEEQEEGMAELCEKADSRANRKEHFYKISFKCVGLVFNVRQKGKKNEAKMLESIESQYPQVKGLDYTIETMRKSDF